MINHEIELSIVTRVTYPRYINEKVLMVRKDVSAGAAVSAKWHKFKVQPVITSRISHSDTRDSRSNVR
jgi:hypothetical protein